MDFINIILDQRKVPQLCFPLNLSFEGRFKFSFHRLRYEKPSLRTFSSLWLLIRKLLKEKYFYSKFYCYHLNMIVFYFLNHSRSKMSDKLYMLLQGRIQFDITSSIIRGVKWVISCKCCFKARYILRLLPQSFEE